MKNFLITESEKQRILEMHQSATSRQYLGEAPVTTTTTTKKTPSVMPLYYHHITVYFRYAPNTKLISVEGTSTMEDKSIRRLVPSTIAVGQSDQALAEFTSRNGLRYNYRLGTSPTLVDEMKSKLMDLEAQIKEYEPVKKP